MATRDPKQARKNWVRWVAIYRATHPKEVPTKTALAKKLRVAKSTLTMLLDPESERAPSFETLIAASDASGFGIDLMLSPPPPELDVLARR